IDDGAARQILEYLAAAKAALGALPTLDTLVFERFFDSVGGMQLVIHSPYGSRVNRAWGLALRKRFCTRFNFELQAAATEDNIVLSLTTAHSFDLADVKNYLHPNTVRGVLIEALLDAPMFTTRWRWVAGVALALPSPLALEVLSARPYAYLDDAPLEERRTQAVMGRRWLAPEDAADLGKLDPEAIARVREEAWPDTANPDELHDALVWLGFLT